MAFYTSMTKPLTLDRLLHAAFLSSPKDTERQPLLPTTSTYLEKMSDVYKEGRVTISLDELTQLLRSVQVPKTPKSGLSPSPASPLDEQAC
jgi:hypothetical protein